MTASAARCYVLVFDYRSDDGPSTVGPFPDVRGAEAHLVDLMRTGFESESQVVPVWSVIDSIRKACS